MDIAADVRSWFFEFESVRQRSMNEDKELTAKLANLEALFLRAGSSRERSAAGAAIERLQSRLSGPGVGPEPEVELQYMFPDMWCVDLFCAVYRKHGVRTYRYKRQRHTTVMARTREQEFPGMHGRNTVNFIPNWPLTSMT